MSEAIRKLTLHHYRNYDSLNISLHEAPIVLTGANGAGKTNVLEAISMFSPGRGLRSARLNDITKQPINFSNLQWATSITLDDSIHLSTGFEKNSQGTEKRIYRFQHEPIKNKTIFSEWLNIIWLTPANDRLFLEAPQLRRKFIDRLIYAEDPLHAERVQRYEYTLKERSIILKDNESDSYWLNSLEEQLSHYGIAIAIARFQLMQKLNQGQEYQDASFPRFISSMVGEIDEWIQQDYAVNSEERFKEALRNNRKSDGISGSTKIGPHRSDWQMIHQEKNMVAEHCSTGEQKILLVTAILSFIQHRVRHDGRLLILLLDDVIAHLDFHHRMVLFEQIYALQNNKYSHLFKGSVQTWLTGTDPMLFETLAGKAQFFTVSNATLFPG